MPLIQTNKASRGSIADLIIEPDGTSANASRFCADQYETVAASATDQVMGATGAIGDTLRRVVIIVSTALTAAVSIKDGAGAAIQILPNTPGGGIGTYTIELGVLSAAGAWSITTGAGSAAIGVGRFT